jgi:ABC-type transporter Mla maintaining outer membrane lipid asymmetry ATPase subunit MlaF
MNPTEPIIEMRGVTVGAMRNPDLIIAENVDWAVAPGEFWVIAGRQGAGKSDFLMLTGGLMAPLAGSYRFAGHAMPVFEDDKLAERLRLGFVFDGGQLFNQLTIAENIALPLRYHQNLSRRAADEATQELLALTELTPFADNTPANVPRGWRKRAGLARALILKPEALLLDNPLGSLDARHTQWWLGFLDELARGHRWLATKPLTLVVTTDALRPWRGVGRHFAMLNDKKFVSFGDWAGVERAEDVLVKELMAAPAVDPRGGI